LRIRTQEIVTGSSGSGSVSVDTAGVSLVVVAEEGGVDDAESEGGVLELEQPASTEMSRTTHKSILSFFICFFLLLFLHLFELALY
jgi:hypothetical protein